MCGGMALKKEGGFDLQKRRGGRVNKIYINGKIDVLQTKVGVNKNYLNGKIGKLKAYARNLSVLSGCNSG